MIPVQPRHIDSLARVSAVVRSAMAASPSVEDIALTNVTKQNFCSRLSRAFARLSTNEKNILSWRSEEKTYCWIAGQLSMGETTVRTAEKRALMKIAHFIDATENTDIKSRDKPPSPQLVDYIAVKMLSLPSALGELKPETREELHLFH